MEWYEELEFDENPLKKEGKYIGNEELLKEVYYSILSGNILILEGEEGSGKTRLLKEVLRKFGGSEKIVYVHHSNLEKELNIETLLIKKNGFLGWLLKKYPKKMILLLDDVEHVSPKNMERIKYFFDSNHVQAVLITTKHCEKLRLSESILQRIRKVLPIRPLSEFEAVQLFRDKIGESILSDRMIKIAYQHSNKNIQKFLNNCELVCKAYIKNKKLNEDDVKKLFERGA